MLETLLQWDRELFIKINSEWTNSFLDAVFPWYRYQNAWMPLYLFLLLFLLMNYGWRIWPFVVAVALTVTATDQLSSHVVKLFFNKTRPCQEASLVGHVRLLLNYCPGNPGFTSSHATNHFGISCLFFFTLRPAFKRWNYLWLAWAATISYAQVYVGIHYPLDVIGGALLGTIIGCIIAAVYNKYIGLPPQLEKPFGFA
jgi:undecaprenyl-diphosphatase